MWALCCGDHSHRYCLKSVAILLRAGGWWGAAAGGRRQLRETCGKLRGVVFQVVGDRAWSQLAEHRYGRRPLGCHELPVDAGRWWSGWAGDDLGGRDDVVDLEVVGAVRDGLVDDLEVVHGGHDDGLRVEESDIVE